MLWFQEKSLKVQVIFNLCTSTKPVHRTNTRDQEENSEAVEKIIAKELGKILLTKLQRIFCHKSLGLTSVRLFTIVTAAIHQSFSSKLNF